MRANPKYRHKKLRMKNRKSLNPKSNLRLTHFLTLLKKNLLKNLKRWRSLKAKRPKAYPRKFWMTVLSLWRLKSPRKKRRRRRLQRWSRFLKSQKTRPRLILLRCKKSLKKYRQNSQLQPQPQLHLQVLPRESHRIHRFQQAHRTLQPPLVKQQLRLQRQLLQPQELVLLNQNWHSMWRNKQTRSVCCLVVNWKRCK